MSTALLQVGKRPGQSLAATSDPGLPFSRLFFIHDFASGTRFLVDTGAEVSVIPPSPNDRHHKTKLTLQAVNGSPIPTYGTRSLTLNIGLRRTFRWIFVIADIQNSILGADFLRHFALLVDVKHNRLLDTTTQLHTQGTPTLLSPWIVSSLHTLNNLIIQHQLHHHPTYSLPLSQAQPPQHLHHELLALDDTFAGLIAFITESWPSLWWGSIVVNLPFGDRHCVVFGNMS